MNDLMILMMLMMYILPCQLIKLIIDYGLLLYVYLFKLGLVINCTLKVSLLPHLMIGWIVSFKPHFIAVEFGYNQNASFANLVSTILLSMLDKSYNSSFMHSPNTLAW